jgi:5'-nucleotidase
MAQPQILLTNDDGILSPGLWAAAGALSELGFVHVAAPRDQYSAAGRSMPITSDGVIEVRQVTVNDKSWKVHAVGGTPAQAVQHGILEIMPARPDLVVAGINFGENPGSGVTISGTIGAALEGASFGIPALAISLETEQKHHYSHSDEVDFSVAAYFTKFFGQMLLEKSLPDDVDVLKVDIPCDATVETPWAVTCQSRRPYFEPTVPERPSWDVPVRIGYHISSNFERDAPDSDIYAVFVRRIISVTPLSLDLTSRLDLAAFERQLRTD